MANLSDLYTNYNYVAYFGILSFLIYHLARGHNKLAITLFLFAFFFKGFSTNVIASLEIWKAGSIALLLFIYLTKRKIRVSNTLTLTVIAIMAIYLVNILILQFRGYGDSQRAVSVYSDFLHNEGRAITQAFYYAIVFGAFCAPFILVKKNTDVFAARSALLHSILLMCILAWLQFAAYQFAGLNIFPINRAGDFDYNSNLLYSDGLQQIFRVNSIAGEPKHLGLAISVGIAILLASRQSRPSGEKHFHLKLLIMLVTLYVTYSTTGYVTALVAVLAALIYQKKTSTLLVSGTILAVIFSASLTALDQSYLASGLSQLQRAGLEVQDLAIFSALIDNPIHSLFGFGIGNIHHYAVGYLPSDFPLFKETPFKANNGLIYIISDFGIIGLTVFSLLYFKSIKSLKSIQQGLISRDEKSAIQFLVIFCTSIYFIFMFRYTELIAVCLGLMLAIIQLNKRSRPRISFRPFPQFKQIAQ